VDLKNRKVKLKMANQKMFDNEGFIETIEADFNTETGNIAFRANFQNKNGLLRNGETGLVLLPIQLEKAILIPQSATFEVLDKKYVYVVDSQNEVHSREIKIQAELPYLFVLKEGLKPSDKILVEGINKIHEKDKIEPVSVEFSDYIQEVQQIKAE
ncbi:MAG: efflux RND transporter periplasmic adaptor subunit, partial [Bacteroidia bacterium]|nr:efflux RND transporter periplasmic adaptor subunit [Bacteroidia bacterium]